MYHGVVSYGNARYYVQKLYFVIASRIFRVLVDTVTRNMVEIYNISVQNNIALLNRPLKYIIWQSIKYYHYLSCKVIYDALTKSSKTFQITVDERWRTQYTGVPLCVHILLLFISASEAFTAYHIYTILYHISFYWYLECLNPSPSSIANILAVPRN